jgi:hypothetical protein
VIVPEITHPAALTGTEDKPAGIKIIEVGAHGIASVMIDEAATAE